MNDQLVKETPIGFWVYEIKPSLIRKRPIVQSGWTSGDYRLAGMKRRWANGETHEVFNKIELLHDPQEWLDAGFAVFDHRDHTMRMPGETFPALVAA